MLGLRLLLTGVPVVVLAALAATPHTAAACLPDPCDSSNRFTSVDMVGSLFATDGVLRIDAHRKSTSAPMEDALAFVQVEVTEDGGGLVDGALEYQPTNQTVVWRPAAPLSPLTSYDVSMVIDNDALALALDFEGIANDSSCGENLQVVGDFLTSETSLPPLAPPDPIAESTHELQPIENLGTMVCCDGAYPEQETLSCVDIESDVSWSDGFCTTDRANGRIRTVESFSDMDFPLHVANDLVLLLTKADGSNARHAIPGQLSAWLDDDEPLCTTLQVTSLATGESWTGPEHCYGDEFIDQLGNHGIDPTDALAVCMGQPYICEVDGISWDPEACTPWGDPPGGSGTDEGSDDGGDDNGGEFESGDEGGDGDGDGGDETGDTTPQDDGLSGSGCACRARGDQAPGSWLLLAALWGWRVRRRSA